MSEYTVVDAVLITAAAIVFGVFAWWAGGSVGRRRASERTAELAAERAAAHLEPLSETVDEVDESYERDESYGDGESEKRDDEENEIVEVNNAIEPAVQAIVPAIAPACEHEHERESSTQLQSIVSAIHAFCVDAAKTCAGGGTLNEAFDTESARTLQREFRTSQKLLQRQRQQRQRRNGKMLE